VLSVATAGLTTGVILAVDGGGDRGVAIMEKQVDLVVIGSGSGAGVAAISARISCHVLQLSGILHGVKTMSPSPTGDPDHAVAPHRC
jgi:hypothetical protein